LFPKHPGPAHAERHPAMPFPNRKTGDPWHGTTPIIEHRGVDRAAPVTCSDSRPWGDGPDTPEGPHWIPLPTDAALPFPDTIADEPCRTGLEDG
jgi:hypothetical protein